jgi:hypothetical protein
MELNQTFEGKVTNDITVEHKEWFAILHQQIFGQSERSSSS